MKIPKLKKSKKEEKVSNVSKKIPCKINAKMQNENQTKKEIELENDQIRPFRFDKEGFEILWNVSKNLFVIFIDPKIYDLETKTMYHLNKKIADLFFEFYAEETNKIAKENYENTKFGNFIENQ